MTAGVLLDCYEATVTELTARALHCCYGGTWPSRLGGIAALNSLVHRLPASALPRLAPLSAKAIFAVLRVLPELSAEEQQLSDTLQAVLARCCGLFQGLAPSAEQHVAQPVEPAKSVAVASGGEPVSGGSPGSTTVELAGAVGSKAAVSTMPSLLKQMMDIFVQQLLSSRSSLPARTVASKALEVRLGVAAMWCVYLTLGFTSSN